MRKAMTNAGRALGALWLALAACGGVARAEAEEVKVLSAGAVRSVLTEVAQTFASETGHSVKGATGTVGLVREKLAAGEPADVVIATDVAIDELIRQGVVVPYTRTDIARAGIGVGVRLGAPRPDISTPDAFKRTLLAAKSLVYVDPAQGATSGIHFASVLRRLGIAEAVKDKSILWPGGYAAEAVANGQAELVVHQISEILPVKGVTLVGPLPKDLQKITIYSAGLVARAHEGARPDLNLDVAAAPGIEDVARRHRRVEPGRRPVVRPRAPERRLAVEIAHAGRHDVGVGRDALADGRRRWRRGRLPSGTESGWTARNDDQR